MNNKLALCALISLAVLLPSLSAEPVRIAVAGLSHGHVNWILRRENRGDIELVGICEGDRELASQYRRRYNLPEKLFFTDLVSMLEKADPQGVAAFNPISEHLEVLEACAPRGVHVMVEKPLAFRNSDAQRMKELAEYHGIHLLTNFETTWYGSTASAFERIVELGELRKIVVRDGHRGPKEIGVGPEFLSWLTDPDKNGGGALIDFGCYGANLITALMGGKRPLTVTAVTQQLKPEIYPRVDDEATILLAYRGAQGIIQASWNWPFNRKDMSVYGKTGYLKTLDSRKMTIRLEGMPSEVAYEADPRPAPFDDPFAYFAAVVRGDVSVAGTDLSSLPINMTVVEILDAARESARTGKAVRLNALR